MHNMIPRRKQNTKLISMRTEMFLVNKLNKRLLQQLNTFLNYTNWKLMM